MLDRRRRGFLESLRCQVVHVAPAGSAAEVVDVDGAYAAHFAERGWEVVVTHPDVYVFCGGSLAELPEIVDDLARAWTPAPAGERHAKGPPHVREPRVQDQPLR